MDLMRWSRTFVAPFLIVVAVACSSPGGSTGGDGGGDGTEPTDAPEQTAASTVGGGGGGGSGSADLDAIYEQLTPPNSTETTKTAAENIIFAVFESSDSIDSLKSFYDDAIPATGLQIFSTTEAQGGFAWTIAESEGSTFGGAVSIYPSGSGSGTAVSVTIGNGE
jgi:hypothetical protein